MDHKRNIGIGNIRSSSGSSIPFLQSASSSGHPQSPAEQAGFGDGPYGASSSKAMQDVTKLALGTASLGKRTCVKQRTGIDASTCASNKSDHQGLVQSGCEIDLSRRWKVDDKGWVVGSKPNSSPKVLRTGGLLPAAKFNAGMRAVTAHNAQPNNDSEEELAHDDHSIDNFAAYESPKVARGRVLGSKKESIQLTTVAGAENDDHGIELPSPFPVRNPTIRQVKAYKHYQEKARHNSLREYKTGFAPRSWEEKKDEDMAAVTEAGWEARKTRQWGKIDRLCDELYEACSSGQMTSCGADERKEEGSEDTLLSLRLVDVEAKSEISTDPALCDSRTIAQASRSQRPPLLIHRKPVSSPTKVPQLIPTQSSLCSTNLHTRSSSSPAINPPPTFKSQSLLAAQLRSSSSSPPKKPRLPPTQRPKLDEALRGITLPCAFPTASALNVEDDVDEPWPADSKHCESSGTMIVRRRGLEKPGLRKWKTLEIVPLPFASAAEAPLPHLRKASNCGIESKGPSLEGPELLYSPPLRGDRPATVTFELHPRIKDMLAEVQRLGCEALKQRGWFFWAVKIGMLCWVAVVLWALLDAIREGLRRVLWPFLIAWDFGVWIVGG